MHERNLLVWNMFAQICSKWRSTFCERLINLAWKIIWGNCLGGNYLKGNYPWDNYPGANCPGANFSRRNCLGDNCPGGNYPGGNYPGGNCLGEVVQGTIVLEPSRAVPVKMLFYSETTVADSYCNKVAGLSPAALL